MLFLFTALGLFGGIIGSELNTEYNLVDKIIFGMEVGVVDLNTTSVDTIIEDCQTSIDIDGKLECVRAHLLKFYIYQVRADNESITFAELMNDGGDCGNWADFWEYVGEQYDFDIMPARISVNKTTAHRFSILSNDQGYCRVDQRQVDCMMYN